MHRAAAILATLVAVLPAAATASEDYVQLASIRPHRPHVVAEDARALLRDINATRAQHGLPALAEDRRLSQFALAVAERMAQHHYFGHTDPSGVTYRDRLGSSGLRYTYAGENLAFDRDEPHVHQAFLHSPSHYANIVDPRERRVGTAAVSAGDGEVFYVEEFSD